MTLMFVASTLFHNIKLISDHQLPIDVLYTELGEIVFIHAIFRNHSNQDLG